LNISSSDISATATGVFMPAFLTIVLSEKHIEDANASKDFRKLILNWKDTVETRIAKMEEQIAGVKENFDKLHEGILGKVGEYDKNVKDIGVELKALEEVFKRILPGFVENVNELSRITGYLKKKPVAANPGTIPKKII